MNYDPADEMQQLRIDLNNANVQAAVVAAENVTCRYRFEQERAIATVLRQEAEAAQDCALNLRSALLATSGALELAIRLLVDLDLDDPETLGRLTEIAETANKSLAAAPSEAKPLPAQPEEAGARVA